MSQYGGQDAEVEIDLLLQHISRTKKLVTSMGKQFFENNLNYQTPFEDDTKNLFKNKMLDLLNIENQLKQQQQASSRVQYQGPDIDNITPDQSIESILEAENLTEKFNSALEQLKQSDDFNPLENCNYKSLINFLKDDTVNSNEDIEMLQTDFTIPIDPFSKMEIVNPVRNISCNHLYEKKSFYEMFDNRPRNSTIKCPYTGCANKKVTINDVEEDTRTKILIDNCKRQQS